MVTLKFQAFTAALSTRRRPFHNSKLYASLEQEDTKVWQYSTDMLYLFFKQEEKTRGKLNFPMCRRSKHEQRSCFFSVFCLENYKAYKSLTGKQTAELFRQYGVFD